MQQPAILLGQPSRNKGQYLCVLTPPAAAELMGDEAEATFWRRLPATLAWLQQALETSRRRSSGGSGTSAGGSGRASSMDDAARGAPGLARVSGGSSSAAGGRPPLGDASLMGSGVGPSPKFGSSGYSSSAAAFSSGAGGGSGTSSSGGCRRLWEEGLELEEARERSGWHEQMSRRVFEDSEDLQVCLGLHFDVQNGRMQVRGVAAGACWRTSEDPQVRCIKKHIWRGGGTPRALPCVPVGRLPRCNARVLQL